MGSIPAWGAVGCGGQECSGGLSPGPFCVEFACSPRVHKGFPQLPQEQKTDGSPHLVPGRLKKLPTAPGVLEEGPSGMGKKQRLNSLGRLKSDNYTIILYTTNTCQQSTDRQ